MLEESDPRPLREQVRDVMRRWIIEDRLTPGAPIREREVAAQLGVSRVPVREAIRMLEVEGFVTSLPRKGAVVRRLRRQDVEELFDLREALEVLEARLAAARADAAGLRRLNWLLEDSKACVEAGDQERLGETNTAYHDQIATLAGNRTLTTVLDPIAGRLRWNYAQNAEPERIWNEHALLRDAIAAGDPERAGAMALEHVRASRRMVLDSYRR